MLPAVSTTYYNGVTFEPYSRTKVEARPIPDSAGRVTKYVEYKIHITGYVTASSAGAADTALTTMRQSLAARGGTLRYTSKGYGNFTVNDATGPKDVKVGPIPEVLSFTPLPGAPGSPACAYVEFVVTTCIPDCPDAKYEHGLVELCYQVEYKIDLDGLTNINITGDLEIPINGAPQQLLTDQADRWREQLSFPVPLGFQRTEQSFRLSQDRRRLDFTINDKELLIPLPNGVTMASVDHRVSGKAARQAFQVWENTISGTVKMNPLFGKSSAYTRFMMILLDRLDLTILDRTLHQRPVSRGSRRPFTIMISSIDITEEIFSFQSRFSVTYLLMGVDMTDILRVSGLWTPIPELSVAGWRDSMADGPHHIRGNLRVAYSSDNDIIVNLCHPQPTSPSTPRKPLTPVGRRKKKTYPPQKGGRDIPPGGTPGWAWPNPIFLPRPGIDIRRRPNGNDLTNPLPGGGPVFGLPAPLDGSLPPRLLNPLPGNGPALVNPIASWLRYEMFLEVESDHRVSRHQPLAGTITENTVSPNALGNILAMNADIGGARLTTTTAEEAASLFQRTAAPSAVITLYGRAWRLGFRINPPRLERYEGQEVTLVYDRIIGGVVSSINGTPIFFLQWVLRYVIPRAPQRHLMPANPLARTDGDGAQPLPNPVQGQAAPVQGEAPVLLNPIAAR